MKPIFALHGESPVVSAVAFKLLQPTITIGRSAKCDLAVRDGTVSRRHAELYVSEEKASICDLCSCNGTFINGERVSCAEIKFGDQVQLGTVSFRVRASAGAEKRDDSDSATDRNADKPRAIGRKLHNLSPAQRRVVELLLEGLPEKLVAARLNLSITTVHNHIQAVYRIFNVHSRSELLVLLLEK